MKIKHVLFGLLVLILPIQMQAQTLLTEDFQSYQGFGSTLTGGWTTSGVGGYKVYLRNFSLDSTIKICEVPLGQNKTGDSLITPSFGPLAENAVLEFSSRLVDTYTGNTAVFNHIPAAGDVVAAYLSTDGGNSYSLLQNLLPSYPNSGLAFVNFSLPISGQAGNNAKVKIVTKRTNGAWYPNFDNFVAYNVTSSGKKLPISGSDLRLFPNPASGTRVVNLQATGFGPQAKLEIFNILGTKIASQPLGSQRLQLDLGHLDAGLYMVKVTEGKTSSLSRLVLK